MAEEVQDILSSRLSLGHIIDVEGILLFIHPFPIFKLLYLLRITGEGSILEIAYGPYC